MIDVVPGDRWDQTLIGVFSVFNVEIITVRGTIIDGSVGIRFLDGSVGIRFFDGIVGIRFFVGRVLGIVEWQCF
jgi:hypothetical protein